MQYPHFTTYLIGATTLNSSRGNYMSYLLLDTWFSLMKPGEQQTIAKKQRAIRLIRTQI